MSRLLIDTIPFKMSKSQINESLKENNGRLIVEGVLQRAEAENQNGRIYPTEILRREVKKYIGREIKENRAFGELDHPESSVVELKNTSHIIREVWWEGENNFSIFTFCSSASSASTKIRPLCSSVIIFLREAISTCT